MAVWKPTHRAVDSLQRFESMMKGIQLTLTHAAPEVGNGIWTN